MMIDRNNVFPLFAASRRTVPFSFMRKIAISFALLFTVSFSAMAEEAAAEAAEREEGAVVYATATFGQKFSPFFNTTVYDREVVDLTQGVLFGYDRGGAMIEHGIEGETRTYNGTDYTYYTMGKWVNQAFYF